MSAVSNTRLQTPNRLFVIYVIPPFVFMNEPIETALRLQLASCASLSLRNDSALREQILINSNIFDPF
jgi:hypothetical protein